MGHRAGDVGGAPLGPLFAASGAVAGALAVVTKLLLAAIVLLVTADVAMRNLAKPITWSVSLTEYLLIYVAFLPMPALVRSKGHVCADFIRSALPPKLRRAVGVVVYLLCVGICLHLGWVAFKALLEHAGSGAYDVRTFDMPRWLIDAPMVVGLWLSALEFVRFLLGHDSLWRVDPTGRGGF